MKQYKASLDTAAWVITISISALLGFVAYISSKRITEASELSNYGIHVFSLLICVFTMLTAWLFAPSSYEITGTELIVRRPAGSRRFLLADIENSRQLNKPDMKGVIRTFGVGGLFGYYGKFTSSSLGPFTMYCTKMSHLILLTLRSGKKIVLSPDDVTMINYFRPH
jgi:hypothetical protein